MLKQLHRSRRKNRIRAKIAGTAAIPRVSVFRSNTQLSLQLIDDQKSVTMASATTLALKEKANKQGAEKVAQEFADKAKKLGITKIVFDRNGYNYHGNVKAMAEVLRASGLQF